MTPAGLVQDLVGQWRAERRRRALAEQAARAAARLTATCRHPHRLDAAAARVDVAIVDGQLLTALEAAVSEWQDARGRTGAVTVDLGRLVLSTTWQAHAAPIVDEAAVTVGKVDNALTPPGHTFEQLHGYAIRSPWRRHALHRAIVVARRPKPNGWARPLTADYPRSIPG